MDTNIDFKEDNKNILIFDETNEKSIIKIIGVGGGGGNAVSHMYQQGIHNVSFVVCNTDKQALNTSQVPVRLQLGKEGLGAGNIPERAREAAEETIDGIHNILNDGTKMVFITAGMGGGTGTGAAPVVAREAKKMGILTVGIVTIPFLFEGKNKIAQALDGVEAMEKNVDALLVINNERLRHIYNNLSVLDAFAKADDTLTIAAKSIAEIITVKGLMNLDFNDVKTVLKDGGVAIMSSGYGEGEGRLRKAIDNALHSPLLNNNDIFRSKKVLLSISFHSKDKECPGLMMDEMTDLNDFMEKFGTDYDFKWGIALDEKLGEQVKVTILATGFHIRDVEGMEERINSRKTQEEINKDAQKQIQAKIIDDKIQTYYSISGKNGYFKPKHLIFLYQPEDLDNEELILAIDSETTCGRTAKKLEELNKLSKRIVETEVAEDEAPAAPSASAPTQSMINFD